MEEYKDIFPKDLPTGYDKGPLENQVAPKVELDQARAKPFKGFQYEQGSQGIPDQRTDVMASASLDGSWLLGVKCQPAPGVQT